MNGSASNPEICFMRDGSEWEFVAHAAQYETRIPMVICRDRHQPDQLWTMPLSEWQKRIARPDRPLEERQDSRAILKDVFGYEAFREGQEEVIDAILAGRDVLAVMPTGAGKSLCYQIPALMRRGVTLVISPLISLMKDQVQALVQNGVPAAFLNSTLSERQCELVYQNLLDGRYKILYVAPERLLTGRFLAVARQMEIPQLIVDEAHCISQWGQDFRPKYLDIVTFRNHLPSRPATCAFTATATARVREDIRRLLELDELYELVTGFDRKNLYYSVTNAQGKNAELLRLAGLYRGLSGIIYCATRKKVEEVHSLLLKEGFSATRYHAGLSDEERRQNQDDFVYDRCQIMVATNAFGMGIDKADVRFVIHYNMPKDPESYYQEAGRAGRDGERADCHLLFSRQDIVTQKALIEHTGEEAELPAEDVMQLRSAARQRLNAMISYCQTPACLRVHLLRYFGEKPAFERCEYCSNCLMPRSKENATAEALLILLCAEELHGRFGATMIVDTLRGADNQRTRRCGADRLLSYGALKGTSENKIRQIIDRMLEMEILKQDVVASAVGQFPLVSAGPNAEALKQEATSVEIYAQEAPRRSASNGRNRTESLSEDEPLYRRLSDLRRSLAEKQGVPAYMIFSDRTLREMAAVKPSNPAELLQIHGVGETKARRYGKQFLQEILR